MAWPIAVSCNRLAKLSLRVSPSPRSICNVFTLRKRSAVVLMWLDVFRDVMPRWMVLLPTVITLFTVIILRYFCACHFFRRQSGRVKNIEVISFESVEVKGHI